MIKSVRLLAIFFASIIFHNASAQYCTPVFQVGCRGNTIATSSFLYADINTFTLTGADGTVINDSSTGCSSPFSYTDHTYDTVTLYQWATYSGAINSDGTPGGNMQIYVDFNDDGIFQTIENIGGINGIATGPAFSTFNLLVPPSASAGNHRMRVIVTDSADAVYPNIDPCAGVAPSNYVYGEVHDYTANINLPVCPPPDPIVIDSITDTSAAVTFYSVPGPGWQYVLDTTDAASYTPSLPPIPFTSAPIDLSGLTQGTTYYLFVRDTCSAGGYSSWVKKTFTTTTCPAIIPSIFSTDSTAQIIWGLTVGTEYGIGYEFVIDTIAGNPTETVTDSVSGNMINVTGLLPATLYYAHVRDSCGPEELSVWTNVPFSTSCPVPSSIYAGNISDSSVTISWIPGNAAVGSGYEYVIDTNAADPLASGTGITDTVANVIGLLPATTYYAHLRDSCGRSGNFSGWLTISFNTYPECRPPLSITANMISDSGAAISWVPDSTSAGLGYEYTISTSSTVPIISGTITADTLANASGLLPSTVYYVHIRDSCGPIGNFSAWTTYSFTTAALCLPPVSITASAVTYNSANVSWLPDSASASLQYQYIIDTNSATPSGSGIIATDTFADVTGLLPYTTYYAHVRDSCGATDLSAWVTISFTTLPLPCPGPVLMVSGISDSGAVINWASLTGGAVSNGSQYIINTSATGTTGAVTTMTDTFINATGLLPGTTYYAHVRDSCEPVGNFSFWITTSFTTLPACTLPSMLSAGSITDTSAAITWYMDSTSAGLGYEYVIDTSATASTTINTTTDSFVNASGLLPSTIYYVSLRDSCGPGYFSAWTTISFTTSIRPCPVPTALSVSPLTDSSATISWSTDTTFSGSEFQYVIDTTLADPTGSGITTTFTHASGTGLSPGTIYYAHIRDSCGSGYFSPWTTIIFTTANDVCLAPAGLSASAITGSGATVSWTAVAGSYAYEYMVNTSAADTTGTSSVTTANTVNISALTYGTSYYAHVRDSCYAGYLSSWVTIPFVTSPAAVSNITAGNFEITAYPNPTKGAITIDIKGTQDNDAVAILTDITGKMIRSLSANMSSFNIDMSSMPAGIYLLRYTDSKHNQTIKVNKQ